MPTNVRDPRSIITPDAFAISDALLGTPLARPGKRLVALLIDLLVIGVLTAVLSTAELFVWGVIGLFLLRMAVKGPDQKRDATASTWLIRLSTGCLGTLVILVVLVAFAFIRLSSLEDDIEAAFEEAVLEADPADPGPAPPDGSEAPELAELADADEDVLLAEYATLLAEPQDERDQARLERVRRALAPRVARDTIAALQGALQDERDDVRAERRRAEALEARLDENALVALLRDIWRQLGSAVGLWSLYFTVLTTVWKGQTVGKRLLGIRVLRLDGEPLGWWSSFERGGGYAAGLATGLLGFAQVLWDPNRQGIHDKIVGTVVVEAGAKPLPGASAEVHGAARS